LSEKSGSCAASATYADGSMQKFTKMDLHHGMEYMGGEAMNIQERKWYIVAKSKFKKGK
jgi:hypothetical protein